MVAFDLAVLAQSTRFPRELGRFPGCELVPGTPPGTARVVAMHSGETPGNHPVPEDKSLPEVSLGGRHALEDEPTPKRRAASCDGPHGGEAADGDARRLALLHRLQQVVR